MNKKGLSKQLKEMQQSTTHISKGNQLFTITHVNDNYIITTHDGSYVKADINEVTYDELAYEFERYMLDHIESESFIKQLN